MNSSQSKALGAAEVGLHGGASERAVGDAGRAAFDTALITEAIADGAVERRLDRRQDAGRRGLRVIESAQQRTVTVEATESVTVRVVEDGELAERRGRGVARRPRSSEAMAVATPSDIHEIDEDAAQSAAAARAIKRYTDTMRTTDAAPTVKIYASGAGRALAFQDPVP